MTDTSSEKPSSAANLEEARAQGAQGWLQVLRLKLGLAGGQTLRDTLEDALKAPGPTTNFSDSEKGMLERLLRFGASRVDDIMVPRADIIALDEDEPLHELLHTFDEAGNSRIPLFRETLDDPRGMIHIKDLFHWLMAEANGGKPAPVPADAAAPAPALKGDDVATQLSQLNLASVDLTRPITTAKIRRQVLYVPPSMPAADLLIRMQATRIHMALVVDEYGGTDGLVTIEDLVEQIVGDIEDEHDDAEETNISVDAKQGIIASGRTPVSELEEHLGHKLLSEGEEAEIDTLGGLVFALLGRVPARGELIRHASGIEFEVLDADPRRVKKIKVHLPRATPAKPATAAEKAG
jgi:CBS domain containing-hemolysin-like protein